MNDIKLNSIKFVQYKAFGNFNIALKKSNILVGANNSGKSTILGAIRLLHQALRHARSRKAEFIGYSYAQYGYKYDFDETIVSIKNVHTNYDTQEKSVITYHFSEKRSLTIEFDQNNNSIFYLKKDNKEITTPKDVKQYFNYEIMLIPTLGPVENDEQIVLKETVEKNLNTHRAARNFRNYWYHYPENFEGFKILVKNTWNGMEIGRPERASLMDNEVYMYCIEDGLTREIFWAGFGFQIWCQLLTHLSRAINYDLIVVDEPEIYLHPELQRKILHVISDTNVSFIFATHSSEIISEAEYNDLLFIDKTSKYAKRLSKIENVQEIMNAIGSIQNIHLTQLAKNKRMLFVEGLYDFRIIKKFASLVGLEELSLGVGMVVMESGGYSHKDKISSFAWGVHETLDSELKIFTIFDRDYWCDEEIEHNTIEMQKTLTGCYFHKRKEIENYLLSPSNIEKAIKRVVAKSKRKLQFDEDINRLLDNLSSKYENKINSQLLIKRNQFLIGGKISDETIAEESMKIFKSRWNNLEERLKMVSGKQLLKDLRTYLQDNYSISITDNMIINEFSKESVPTDLIELLNKLENFRTQK